MSIFNVGDKVVRLKSSLSPRWKEQCREYNRDIKAVFTVSGVSSNGGAIRLQEMDGRYDTYSFAKIAAKQEDVPVNKERNLNDLLTKLENIVDRLEKLVDGK